MKHSLPLLALAALASIPVDADAATRNFGISGFDRVRIDGPYAVRLATGVAPYARATSTSTAALDAVTVRVEGRTLIVRRAVQGSQASSGPVTIEIGTHDLSVVWLNGSGSVDIDRVKALDFNLNVVGAGAARIGQVDVDILKVGVAGSGTIRLSGRANSVSAIVRGTSNLDAEALRSKDTTIGAEGPSLVRLSASNAARVDAIGLASVTLTGNPSCTLRVQGSASVSGCKEGGR